MSAYYAGSRGSVPPSSPVVNGGRSSSPGRAPSEGGHSVYSQKSTGSRAKTYPKKGSTLGNIELSPEEMEHLEKVLERFDQFRLKEDNRVRTLRDRLVEKQKVRIRNAEASGDGHCYNCGRLFMAVFNPPVQCYLCRHEFCRLCLEKMPKSKDLICKFCRFESVHRGQLGVWFTEELKVARAQGRVRGVSGPEALRSSLLRIKRESRANSLIQNAPSISPSPSLGSLEDGAWNTPDSDRDYDYLRSEPEPLTNQSPEQQNATEVLAKPVGSVRASDAELNVIHTRSVQQLEQETVRSKPQTPLVIDRDQPARYEGTSPRVSIEYSPLKTSTVNVSRNKMSFGEFEASEGEPRIGSLDTPGQETPLKPTPKWPQSYENLRNRGSMESLPMGSDSGYGPPRTESWVQESQKEHDQRSIISTKNRRDLTPERPPTEAGSIAGRAYSGAPSVISDRLVGTAAGGSRPATPSRQELHSSFSDLRSQAHQPRLTSEAGSKSTLSLASKQSGSMLSLYSERESSYTHGVQITGDLRLDIRYDTQSSTLRIAVKQARDLAIVDKKHQACNPYVKSYLLPDKTKGSKRKTSYKKHTRNPVFDEELKYTIPYGELSERSLQIAVWHKASVGTNLFLGEVIIPFADFSFESGANWYPLTERRQIALTPSLQIFRGELLLALKLVPGGTMGRQSELHVWIKSAKGLSTSTSGRSKSSTVNSYCKIYLLPDRAKSSKRKTGVIKKKNDPEWNMNFVYQNIDRTQLNGMGLEVSIWDHSGMSNDFLGGCRINTGDLTQKWKDATGTEQTVWHAIMERPQTWFEGLIRLRSNLD